MKAIALLIFMTLFAVLGSEPSYPEKTTCHKTPCSVVYLKVTSTPEPACPVSEHFEVTFLADKTQDEIQKPFSIFRPPISS